jgi:hypothetical protein
MYSPGDFARVAIVYERVKNLADLLRETAEHHDHHAKTHPTHDWWDWYAPYISAREHGSSSEQACNAADRYIEARHELAR